jgi:hypothetical protein
MLRTWFFVITLRWEIGNTSWVLSTATLHLTSDTTSSFELYELALAEALRLARQDNPTLEGVTPNVMHYWKEPAATGS